MKMKLLIAFAAFTFANSSFAANASGGASTGGLGLIDNNPMVELGELEPGLLLPSFIPNRTLNGAIDKEALNQLIRLNPENFKEISEELDMKRLNVKSAEGLKSFEKIAADEDFVLMESPEGELAGIEAVKNWRLETNGEMLVDEVEVTIELAE